MMPETKKYSLIYADCPWSFNNKNTGGSMTSGAEYQYKNVMSVEGLGNLPIAQIAADDCVLFFWWVGSQPAEALHVVKSWGFKMKTMTGFTWIKKTKHGKPFFGMGFYTRQGSENCLIATRGKSLPHLRNIRAVIESPIERHSKKPDIFRNTIVQMYGDIPRVELFARENHEGWDAFGNEVENSITLPEKKANE